MPTWLAVQRSKVVFFLIIYDSINDISYFRSVCITHQPCYSHFCDDCCQFVPSWMFGLEMELMACADLVAGTTEQNCLFPDLI